MNRKDIKMIVIAGWQAECAKHDATHLVNSYTGPSDDLIDDLRDRSVAQLLALGATYLCQHLNIVRPEAVGVGTGITITRLSRS